MWTDAELCRLKHYYPEIHTRTLAKAMGKRISQVYNMAYKLGLKKSAEYLASPLAGRNVHERGAAHQFKKGQIPWNKGKHHAPEGSKQNHFRPGHMPHNWRPVGDTKIDKDGIHWRKVADTRHKPTDWKREHHILWEEHNGRIPEGHIVVFSNGNSHDIRIKNLECITRAENVRRNAYWNKYPEELRSVIMQKAVLTRRINERCRDEKQG